MTFTIIIIWIGLSKYIYSILKYSNFQISQYGFGCKFHNYDNQSAPSIVVLYHNVLFCDRRWKRYENTNSAEPEICFVDIVEPSCHHLIVHNADRADCNGEYALSNKSVNWAPDKPVYRHVYKNRLEFWNTYCVSYYLNCKADILEC